MTRYKRTYSKCTFCGIWLVFTNPVTIDYGIDDFCEYFQVFITLNCFFCVLLVKCVTLILICFSILLSTLVWLPFPYWMVDRAANMC